ncbi:MAG: hypothetical protein KDK34_18625 [Leptospiraceae bacterium]|nr:hypothetical protein [Leptospiraceae bacterium]
MVGHDNIRLLFTTPAKQVVITDGYKAQRDGMPVFATLAALLAVCGLLVVVTFV